MNNSPLKISSRVLPVVTILALSGCSYLDVFSDIELSAFDVFGLFEDDQSVGQVAAGQGLRNRASIDRAAAEGANTPSLTSVPSRPAGGSTVVRDRVVEGLISDRDNARYTDEAIRLQGSTRPSTTLQAVAAPSPKSAPFASSVTQTPSSITSQIAVVPPPVPVAPIGQGAAMRPAHAQAPRPAQSESTVVNLSALGGAGYIPVSAQIRREEQVATIQFGYSSSRLGKRDKQLISAVASAYRRNGGNILVVGHASARTQQLPKSKYQVANFKVSFARANSVAQALIRAGVESESVIVEAVADSQPIYSESMPSGEAGNRRAEIYFLR